MITITYLDSTKTERTLTYDTYEEFESAQLSCLVVPDYYGITSLTINGHALPYTGNMGGLYAYVSQLDRTALA